MERAEGPEVRAPDDAAGSADCQVVEVAQPGPRGVLGAYGRALSGFGGGWSEQPFVSCFGAFVGHQTIDRSRDGMWATVPRQCCRPIGRSCDGEPRDVAPAAGSDAPTRRGSPSALSSGRRSTIRTSQPDRLRPAGSLNRGQPRHAATRKRSGSRSSAQRPTHGTRSDTRPDVARGAGPGPRGASLAPFVLDRHSTSTPRRERFGPTPGEDPVSESPPEHTNSPHAPRHTSEVGRSRALTRLARRGHGGHRHHALT